MNRTYRKLSTGANRGASLPASQRLHTMEEDAPASSLESQEDEVLSPFLAIHTPVSPHRDALSSTAQRSLMQQRHAAVLSQSHRNSGTISQQHAGLMLQLQRTYGNTYTAEVARIPRDTRTKPKRPAPAKQDNAPPADAKLRVTIEAARQGTIVFYAYSVQLDVQNTAAGSQGGKPRPSKGFVISKPVDDTTAQLYKALLQGENLNTVKLEFLKTEPDGTITTRHTMNLENAMVASASTAGNSESDQKPLESVSFSLPQRAEQDNER